jgi:hypothetical protein
MTPLKPLAVRGRARETDDTWDGVLKADRSHCKSFVNQNWLTLGRLPLCRAGLVGRWYKGSQLTKHG